MKGTEQVNITTLESKTDYSYIAEVVLVFGVAGAAMVSCYAGGIFLGLWDDESCNQAVDEAIMGDWE